MIPVLPMIKCGKSTLYAVPAIHGDHVFASTVRRFCLRSPQRPEAIAVELGPWMAAAAASLIRYIEAARDGKLPVMLGILRSCRLIKPSLKEKAFALQQKTGKNLNELPPDILLRELEFSGSELLCLSPTDSIIEAIRCSIEWDIPLYGVDLEEVAAASRDTKEIEDSLFAGRGIVRYIERNSSLLAESSDPEIDARRELVMAARLNNLLERHESVLFTCGIGHWKSIRELIADPGVQPAKELFPPRNPPGDVQRVIVHPQIGAPFLDRFPVMAKFYEEWRAGTSELAEASLPCPSKVLKRCLAKACRSYFSAGKKGAKGPKSRGLDFESLPGFEKYLGNLALLSSKVVPNLPLLVTAAQETMSGEFTEALVGTLMDLPWASTKDYPDYPLLSPGRCSGKKSAETVFLKSGGSSTDTMTIMHLPRREARMVPMVLPYHWESEKTSASLLEILRTSGGDMYSWLPWDYLTASLCLEATRKARKSEGVLVSEPFEGSLCDGIDIKATLRGFSRGEDVFLVRDRTVRMTESVEVGEAFPVVWILTPEALGPQMEWMILRDYLDELEPYVRDKHRLQKVQAERGKCIVCHVCYTHRENRTRTSRGGVFVETIPVLGQVVFAPSYFTHHEFAEWAEATGYSQNPFINFSSPDLEDESDLGAFYVKELGVSVGQVPWETALVLMALPFARNILPVVVPDGWQFDRLVYQKAADYGVSVRPIRLEDFPEQEIQRMTACQLVSPLIRHHPVVVYPRQVEKLIGESQKAYRDRLPRDWLNSYTDDAIAR